MIQESLSKQILELLSKGQKREQIVSELLAMGHDERFVKEIVTETIKIRNAKIQSQALTLILIGGVLCLLSCIVTMTSQFSNSNFPLVLYGLTTVGIVIVFLGFSKIF